MSEIYEIGEVLIRKAHRGKFNEVKQLVEEYKVNINYKNQNNCTALHAAAASGQLEICQYLMTHRDIDLTAIDDADQTALHYASFYGHLEVVQLLVEGGNFPLNKPDKFGRLVHNAAAMNGHLDVVKYLLEECPNGININSIDQYGGSCLHWAASKGRKEVVQYLCMKGIDVHLTSYDNRTAFQLAKDKHKQKCVQFLKSWTETVQIFLDLVKEGQNNDIQQIIIDINNSYPLRYLKDKDGKNALHWAAERGHLYTLKLLAENFDVITDVDKYGRNALHWAALGGHKECAEYLVKIGSKTTLIHSLTLTNKSPSRCAFEASHISLASKLQAWEEGHDEIGSISSSDKNDNTTTNIIGFADVNRIFMHSNDTSSSIIGNDSINNLSGNSSYDSTNSNDNTVENWLKQCKMIEYYDNFKRDGFDTLRGVSTIDETDLIDMDVKKGHRRVVLLQIEELKNQLLLLDEQYKTQGLEIEPVPTLNMLPLLNNNNNNNNLNNNNINTNMIPTTSSRIPSPSPSPLPINKSTSFNEINHFNIIE